MVRTFPKFRLLLVAMPAACGLSIFAKDRAVGFFCDGGRRLIFSSQLDPMFPGPKQCRCERTQHNSSPRPYDDALSRNLFAPDWLPRHSRESVTTCGKAHYVKQMGRSFGQKVR